MPRPSPWDHLRVLGLAAAQPLGLLWFLLWLIASPVLKPLVRGRLRRKLEESTSVTPDEPPAPDPAAWAGKTVFVSAGEPSGDRLLARVVTAMRRRCPDLRIRGYAGPETAAAGAALDRDLTQHAVMGVVAVIRLTGTWWRISAETLALFREEPPDLFLSVDFPGLNGRLAAWARKRGIPTVHLVPPSVWAYAPWRMRRWRRAVSRMLTVFPFEPPLFEGSGLDCVHVGHPAFEAPLARPRTAETWPGASGPSIVELLPGSRRQEILRHTPVLLDAARRVRAQVPGCRFVARLAHERTRGIFEAASLGAEIDVEVQVGESAYDVPLLGALATSGTVTAELGASLVPHGLFYRPSIPLWLIGLGGLTAPYFGLVNLIARREVVPERLVLRASGAKIAEDFLGVAGSEAAWTTTRHALAEHVRGALESEGVADRAARAVLTADKEKV